MTAPKESGPTTEGMESNATADEQLDRYFSGLPGANKDLLLEVFGGERTTPLTAEEVAERLGTKVFDADLSRFAGNGNGTIYGFQVQGLVRGQRIAVTDAGGGCDTVVAEVLRVDESSAEIRVSWDQILRKA